MKSYLFYFILLSLLGLISLQWLWCRSVYKQARRSKMYVHIYIYLVIRTSNVGNPGSIEKLIEKATKSYFVSLISKQWLTLMKIYLVEYPQIIEDLINPYTPKKIGLWSPPSCIDGTHHARPNPPPREREV